MLNKCVSNYYSRCIRAKENEIKIVFFFEMYLPYYQNVYKTQLYRTNDDFNDRFFNYFSHRFFF